MGIRAPATGCPAPYQRAAAVTLHDTDELPIYAKALWVGGAGNLKLTTVDGDTVTLNGVTAGTLIPITAKVVFSTGSTASSVVALW